MAGMSFVAIASASMGLFIEPLEQEFGWRRAEITIGLTIYALVAVPFTPFIGAMIDRWGSRRLAIPGMFLTALAFCSLSLVTGSRAQWLGLWTFYAFAALIIRNTIWTTAISGVFQSARGLALAITLSGSAVVGAITPVIAQPIIDNVGWREAYLWMGAGWGLLILVLLYFFFYDIRDTRRRQAATSNAPQASAADLPGLSFQQALRSSILIRLGLATLIFILAVTAISIHLVPILSERGFDRQTAAMMAAVTGLTAIVGRLITGWILDRWASGWINALNFAAPSVSCLLLLFTGNSVAFVILAALIIGWASGAFMQIVAYLTGRYAGIRNFGKIFGVMSSMVALGLGVGPVLAGLIYDATGSYTPLLAGVIPAVLLCGLLVFALGPYPDWHGAPRTDTAKP